MSPERLLYDKSAIILLPSIKDENEDYWDGFTERAESAGLGITYLDKAQILIVKVRRGPGDILAVHYAVRRGQPGGGGKVALQPLMAWQRGVGDDDLVMAAADNIGGDLSSLAQRLRQAALVPMQ